MVSIARKSEGSPRLVMYANHAPASPVREEPNPVIDLRAPTRCAARRSVGCRQPERPVITSIVSDRGLTLPRFEKVTGARAQDR